MLEQSPKGRADSLPSKASGPNWPVRLGHRSARVLLALDLVLPLQLTGKLMHGPAHRPSAHPAREPKLSVCKAVRPSNSQAYSDTWTESIVGGFHCLWSKASDPFWSGTSVNTLAWFGSPNKLWGLQGSSCCPVRAEKLIHSPTYCFV